MDEAFEAAGFDVRVWAWDDSAVDWATADVVVIRSTWDYAPRRDAFCRWADEVQKVTAIHNSAAVVRWNTDKHYLGELADNGVAITPTVWIEPGDQIRLPDAAEIVVKPAISAGSQDTTRHVTDDHGVAAIAEVQRLLDAGRSVMVQPYLDGVDSRGETGLVYIDGHFHHAFRKGAILVGGRSATERLYAPEQITPKTATDAELDVAGAALEAMPFVASDLLYARVDVAPGADGAPLLMELELVEPSLFFKACDRPATALADAVAARL